MRYMGDWHQVPMTRLEMVATLVLVLLTAFVIGAIGLEASTGLPARMAVEQWLAR